MNTHIAVTEPTHIARPLAVLVPLIREDLKQAEGAGMPYFRAAGEKLLEAKDQLAHGEFKAWVTRNFSVGYQQASLYMKMVKRSSRDDFSTLQEFRRAHTGYKQTVHPQPWHDPVKEAIGRVNIDALRQDALEKQKERALQRKLALSLIDIGFKALATKLHPDKGGSREAMARLNRVRKLLQQAVSA
jgi:hypothetical protein